MDKRFTIALSYSGDRRPFVKQVADALSHQLGKSKIFYEKYYEEELAIKDAAIYLQNIYENQSKLIVVFVSKGYATSDWCGLEWHSMLRIITILRGDSIMFIRFDDTSIEGLNPQLDGYYFVGKRKSKEVAEAILKRLSKSTDPDAPDSYLPPEIPPRIDTFPFGGSKKTTIVILVLFAIGILTYKLNLPPGSLINKIIPICKLDKVKEQAIFDSVISKLVRYLPDTIITSLSKNEDNNNDKNLIEKQLKEIMQNELKLLNIPENCFREYEKQIGEQLGDGNALTKSIIIRQSLLKDINYILQKKGSVNVRNVLSKYNGIYESAQIYINDKYSLKLSEFLFKNLQITGNVILFSNIERLEYHENKIAGIYCNL